MKIKGIGVQNSGKAGTGVRGQTLALKKAQENKLHAAECECYAGCAELRSWTRLEMKN